MNSRISPTQGLAESKGKDAYTKPQVEALGEICRKWIERKTMRRFPVLCLEVTDEELDRKAEEVWSRKATSGSA